MQHLQVLGSEVHLVEPLERVGVAVHLGDELLEGDSVRVDSAYEAEQLPNLVADPNLEHEAIEVALAAVPLLARDGAYDLAVGNVHGHVVDRLILGSGLVEVE